MKCHKHSENYILSFNTFSKKYYQCDYIDFGFTDELADSPGFTSESPESAESPDSGEKCILVQNKTFDERYMLLYGFLFLLLSYFYSPLAILATIFICIDYCDYYRESKFNDINYVNAVNIEEFNRLKNVHTGK
jgi:hypothetical protein